MEKETPSEKNKSTDELRGLLTLELFKKKISKTDKVVVVESDELHEVH